MYIWFDLSQEQNHADTEYLQLRQTVDFDSTCCEAEVNVLCKMFYSSILFKSVSAFHLLHSS